MKKTQRKIELPLLSPLYSTYHYQGPGTAILVHNPSIRNWYLNQVMMLTCTRKFLHGFTTPEISLADSAWHANPYFDKQWYTMQFLKGHVHFVIRNLLDAGYYVCFSGVDDYYVEGKSWYRERHFSHDGCICGYDRENGTYCLYAYDQNWIYRKFWTPQKGLEAGRKAEFKKEEYGSICGIRPKGDRVAFSQETALGKIAEYLDSDMEKYPKTGEGTVSGIVVHDYIAGYVDRLYDGSVPYEKTDRRVFRMIWEHKKGMLERIRRIEDSLFSDRDLSEAYLPVVQEADNCRMLYAAHQMKKRNQVLPLIRKKLLGLKEKEKEILEKLIRKSKGENMK